MLTYLQVGLKLEYCRPARCNCSLRMNFEAYIQVHDKVGAIALQQEIAKWTGGLRDNIVYSEYNNLHNRYISMDC